MVIMDLLEKKNQLIAQREKLEQVKKDAHEGILRINGQIRKLEGVIKDAEGFFTESQPVESKSDKAEGGFQIRSFDHITTGTDIDKING